MNSTIPASTPTPVYVAGIGTLLYAALGLCTQGWGVVGSVMTSGFTDSLQRQSGMEDLAAVQVQAMRVAGISAGVGLFAVFALIASGTLILARLPAARLAWTGLAFATVVELAQTALAIWQQRQMASAMERMSGPSGAAPMGGWMEGMQAAGIGIIGCWALVKIGFFGWAIFYTLKPETQAFFATPRTPGLRGD